MLSKKAANDLGAGRGAVVVGVVVPAGGMGCGVVVAVDLFFDCVAQLTKRNIDAASKTKGNCILIVKQFWKMVLFSGKFKVMIKDNTSTFHTDFIL